MVFYYDTVNIAAQSNSLYFESGIILGDCYLCILSHHRYILSSTDIYRSRLCLYRRHSGDNGDYSLHIRQDLS